MVGLLVAEWWRRKTGKAVAYLTVTNQLAHQVLEEGKRLGLNCANVTGRSGNRNPARRGALQDCIGNWRLHLLESVQCESSDQER